MLFVLLTARGKMIVKQDYHTANKASMNIRVIIHEHHGDWNHFQFHCLFISSDHWFPSPNVNNAEGFSMPSYHQRQGPYKQHLKLLKLSLQIKSLQDCAKKVITSRNPLGRGPEGSTMHPPPPPPSPPPPTTTTTTTTTSLQNYIFLNPQSVLNKKWDVNSKNIGTHYRFTALF